MTAMLAVTIATLTTGLTVTVLPSTIQEAHAQNPCNIDTRDIDAEEVGNNCEFYGNTEIDAGSPCIGPICPVRPGPILEPIPGLIRELPLDD